MGRLMSASPEHIARGVDRVLRGLDATEAQRAEITKIAQAAAVDLKGQREAGRALREKSAALFVAPVVDAAAVESLRQQMVAQHDATSRRMSQALVDVSKVLRPEQRVKLAERFKHHRGRGFGHGHHGRGHDARDGAPRGEGSPPAPERKPAS
jgi:Spy/CpxP family protein refolding chaperone